MSTPYIGEIRMFAGTFAPVGWHLCDGTLLSIPQYDVLYALIGTTYGGDGQNTFGLPNLQSRIPMHTGPGFIIGQNAGQETVTLTIPQIPLHFHTVNCNSNGTAGTSDPTNAIWSTANGSLYSDQVSTATMNGGALTPAGGSQPHTNLMPYLGMNFIIALQGVYPTQN